jgi:thiamine-phosphate pyrophosphorylase
MKLPYSGYLKKPSGPVQLCYITSRQQFPGNPDEKIHRLLDKIEECVAAGIDYIQLREKDLSTRALESLAEAAVRLFPSNGSKLLINSRADVALACGAHGVHLPAGDLSASEVRTILAHGGCIHPIIGVSVHSAQELAYAEAHGADFAVFAPVFEKDGRSIDDGLKKLAETCAKSNRDMPVLALGGITLENARQCMEARADGVAAIRLFQENDVAKVAAQLRNE